MKQKVRMKEIADKLGLSVNSISLVLNDRPGISEDTRKLVLKTAEEMGYLEQSARYVKAYSSRNICVLIKRIYFRDMHFYSRVLLGIEEEARKNNYDILMSVLDTDDIPGCIEKQKAAGIFIVGKVDTEYLDRVRQYQIPIVLVDAAASFEGIDSVMTDNYLGGYSAVKYLIQNGFQKIGFFGDLNYTASVRERFWGYQEAIKHLSGISSYQQTAEYTQRYSVLSDLENHVMDGNIQEIEAMIRKIECLPEVFFCSNDSAAMCLMNALKDLGYRIPEDVGVMGFDDVDLCTMVVPKLTTVHVNKELTGKKAFQLFLWRLSNRKEPSVKILLGASVWERESVKRRDTDA